MVGQETQSIVVSRRKMSLQNLQVAVTINSQWKEFNGDEVSIA